MGGPVTTTDHRVEPYVDADLYDTLHITAEASDDFIARAYRPQRLSVVPQRIKVHRPTAEFP
jgi:hypothetical protein